MANGAIEIDHAGWTGHGQFNLAAQRSDSVIEPQTFQLSKPHWGMIVWGVVPWAMALVLLSARSRAVLWQGPEVLGWSLGALALIAFGYGCWLVGQGVPGGEKSNLVLDLGPKGILYPALFERRIPWSEISHAEHGDRKDLNTHHQQKFTNLHVRDGARFRPLPGNPLLRPGAGKNGADLGAVPRCSLLRETWLIDQVQAFRRQYGPWQG